MKKGHSVRFCKIIKKIVPNGVMKWIPKDSKASNDPLNASGPKFVRDQTLLLDLISCRDP